MAMTIAGLVAGPGLKAEHAHPPPPPPGRWAAELLGVWVGGRAGGRARGGGRRLPTESREATGFSPQ